MQKFYTSIYKWFRHTRRPCLLVRDIPLCIWQHQSVSRLNVFIYNFTLYIATDCSVPSSASVGIFEDDHFGGMHAHTGTAVRARRQVTYTHTSVAAFSRQRSSACIQQSCDYAHANTNTRMQHRKLLSALEQNAVLRFMRSCRCYVEVFARAATVLGYKFCRYFFFAVTAVFFYSLFAACSRAYPPCPRCALIFTFSCSSMLRSRPPHQENRKHEDWPLPL